MSKQKKIDLKNLKVKDFKEASYNPRSISKEALKKLEKSIQFHGDLSTVTINEATGLVVAGHQRLKTIRDKKTRVVTKPYKDKHGTVAVGEILVESESGEIRIPIRIVNWDKRTEKLANIAANAHGGEFDNQKLGKLLAELSKEQFDIELSGFDKDRVDSMVRKANKDTGVEQYSRKLKSPIYKPKMEKAPKLSEIYDDSATVALKEKIKKANLPKDIEKFLNAAAERHTKFNFAKCAEFYAHADKKIQKLMEDSALVIIDYDRAIELGYVKLTSDISEFVKNGQN